MRQLLIAFGALHALMFVHDLLHPERFLNADRAGERMGVIHAFAARVRDGGDWIAFLSSHGIPGDWAPQALLYVVGGQNLVIGIQVALVLASIGWVYALGRRAGLGEAGAIAAAGIYGLLPHTLVFPHQLATEAIFVPLVILAFYATSGLAWGLAALVRPITMLWPFIQFVFNPVKNPVFLVAALAPLLLWMGFIHTATGEIGMGRSSHDLGHNLYQRMHRMAVALPEAERPERKPAGQTTAGLGEYFAFVLQHPVAAAKHSARDLATLGVKSGVERLVLDYLDLFPESRAALQDTGEGWRAQVERHGPVAAMKQMFLRQPGLMTVSGVFSILFIIFLLFSILGIKHKPLLLYAGFVVYIFLTAQAIDAAQSRHRAPAEFALCLLAVAGWQRLRQRMTQQTRTEHVPWQPIRS
jgi:hypothetical protein